MGVEINAVVELAAAFTDEGQPHPVQEPQTAANVGGGFAAGEISGGGGSLRIFSDDAGRLWTR